MAKKPKLEGQFKDKRGEGVTQYHPWALTQMTNPAQDRKEWVDKIIEYMDEQGADNVSKKNMANYLRNPKACHIIGFAPYVEYIKHKNEGGMTIEGCYVHAFGNPALLVFDKKSKSLLIVGPGIDFHPENGIKG
jgi:hypothetical protein